MENIKLPATLLLIWDIKRSIEKNQSLQIGIKSFLSRQLSCQFSTAFADIYFALEWVKRRVLFTLLFRNYFHPNSNFKFLEKEFLSHCEDDIQAHAMKLPLLLQIPMLGLLFPSIMCLLVVPAMGLLRF